MNRPTDNVTIENAKLIFKDFSGERNPYGNDKTFGIALDRETWEKMGAEGWNVKMRPPREDGDEPLYFIKVKVVFGKVPPKIVLIDGGSGKKQVLDDQTVKLLDWVTPKNADVIIRPYNYDFGGRTGTAAYVKTLYVTGAVDPLDEKYSDYPEEGELGWSE